MKGISINHIEKEVIVASSFMTKSSQFGTEEFKALSEIAKTLPEYKIVLKTNPNLKGDKLNYAKMEEYLELKGSTEQKDKYKKFRTMKTNFLKVKAWFYEEFPNEKK